MQDIANKTTLFYRAITLVYSLGFNTEAYAEQLNNSVKDCLEQPDACGEQSKDSSQTEIR